MKSFGSGDDLLHGKSDARGIKRRNVVETVHVELRKYLKFSMTMISLAAGSQCCFADDRKVWGTAALRLKSGKSAGTARPDSDAIESRDDAAILLRAVSLSAALHRPPRG